MRLRRDLYIKTTFFDYILSEIHTKKLNVFFRHAEKNIMQVNSVVNTVFN